MRVINSLRNSAMSMLQMLLSTFIGFAVRTVFIHTLGNDYNGLNALFTSIISMLSIAELGIGTAIIFNMYVPIAKKDTETIKSLMRFYQRCYWVVAAFVTAVGLILLPFLQFFSKNNYHGISENIYIIYLLFLAGSVSSYFLSYKRDIFYAHQKQYLLSLFDSVENIISSAVFLIILLTTHNFIFYLIAQIVLNCIENVAIWFYANQQYPYLRESNIQKLDHGIIAKFRKQIYGMLYHNIATFIVSGTNSLIISKFIGLASLGLYSNYILISNSFSGILVAIISGVTASIGDLLTEKNQEKSFDAYQKLTFVTFWICSFVASSLFVVMQPFIIIWLGKDSLLSLAVLLVIVLNFYITGMRKPLGVFQSAAGIYYENRHVPVVEAVVNFIASLVLVHFLGLAGVLLGTLVSTMIVYGYSFPKYIYTPTFGRKNSEYVWEQIRWLVTFLAILAISEFVSLSLLAVPNPWAKFFVSLLIALIVPNVLLLLLFHKRPEFQYFKGFIQHFFQRKTQKS
ncbi:lipopolysaccharide biosynthesis protein [Lactococcus nasutitermitis]|uniref:Lipopolysaccharide biosynthesis protein n=1 Tax=Lactococcus nasutitermitis TaxID=1652957 RepID=A0ABV9JF60_9LACT|nr:oligosaccharide flippase family protein [Lactococcus nasutitermitis]